MPAGREHTSHFAERAGIRSHIAQAESDGDDVKRSVGKRKGESVGGKEVRHPFAAGFLEHRNAEVRADEGRRRAMAGERKRQVAAPRREIEDAPGIPCADDPGGPVPPEIVHSAADQMVGKIVATGD